MHITFCGVRGSLPTPLSSDEILNRILSFTKGDQISTKELRHLAKNGQLNYGGDTSCVLVTEDEAHLVIDAGTGLRRINELIPTGDVHILLTHLHWDHIQGMPFLKALYNPNRKVHIHSSLNIDSIQDALKVQWSNPFFPVAYDFIAPQLKFHQLSLKGNIGHFKIEALEMKHPFPTYGYKVISKTGTYAHFSDTEITLLKDSEKARYKKFLDKVDFIAADSQFDIAETELYKNWGHSCINQFIDILSGDTKKTLGLFHYNPMEPEAKVDQIFKQAKTYLKKVGKSQSIKLITCIEGQTIKI